MCKVQSGKSALKNSCSGQRAQGTRPSRTPFPSRRTNGPVLAIAGWSVRGPLGCSCLACPPLPCRHSPLPCSLAHHHQPRRTLPVAVSMTLASICRAHLRLHRERKNLACAHNHPRWSINSLQRGRAGPRTSQRWHAACSSGVAAVREEALPARASPPSSPLSTSRMTC